jgi:SAM-dependent methyltransferase
MKLKAFVEAHLPPAPARVLEVGCGHGDLARAVSESGYGVVAIDPDAPEGKLFQAVALEEFETSECFDAVVASRSLHHIPDLPGAVAKIAGLLRPGGCFILDEHACDRLDEETARWYLEQRAGDLGAPTSLEACLANWDADHHDLHGYAAMRRELDRHFAELFFAWTPYLYGELTAVGEEEERALIEAGAIQAMGFRYVGATERAAQKARPGRQEDVARLEFHDLRHTFASLMIAAGANPLQIAEALGHSDNTGRPDPTLVWKRYGHLYPGSTREAVAALDRHLEALAG